MGYSSAHAGYPLKKRGRARGRYGYGLYIERERENGRRRERGEGIIWTPSERNGILENKSHDELIG